MIRKSGKKSERVGIDTASAPGMEQKKHILFNLLKIAYDVKCILITRQATP